MPVRLSCFACQFSGLFFFFVGFYLPVYCLPAAAALTYFLSFFFFSFLFWFGPVVLRKDFNRCRAEFFKTENSVLLDCGNGRVLVDADVFAAIGVAADRNMRVFHTLKIPAGVRLAGSPR